MVAELTSEQIVTKLLTSNEILKPIRDNFYISNDNYNLGEYLDNLPDEFYEEEIVSLEFEEEENSKYVFIQNKKAIF